MLRNVTGIPVYCGTSSAIYVSRYAFHLPLYAMLPAYLYIAVLLRRYMYRDTPSTSHCIQCYRHTCVLQYFFGDICIAIILPAPIVCNVTGIPVYCGTSSAIYVSRYAFHLPLYAMVLFLHFQLVKSELKE